MGNLLAGDNSTGPESCWPGRDLSTAKAGRSYVESRFRFERISTRLRIPRTCTHCNTTVTHEDKIFVYRQGSHESITSFTLDDFEALVRDGQEHLREGVVGRAR